MNEIEKKFLVKEIPTNLENFVSDKIIQGYLNITSEPVIRIRAKKNKYF